MRRTKDINVPRTSLSRVRRGTTLRLVPVNSPLRLLYPHVHPTLRYSGQPILSSPVLPVYVSRAKSVGPFESLPVVYRDLYFPLPSFTTVNSFRVSPTGLLELLTPVQPVTQRVSVLLPDLPSLLSTYTEQTR